MALSVWIYYIELHDIASSVFCNILQYVIHYTMYLLLRMHHTHAAIVSGGKGTAQGKIQTLREAGVTVVESPAKIGTAMLDVFKQRGLAS